MASVEAQQLWDEMRKARDPDAVFDLAQERENTRNIGDLIPRPPGVDYLNETIAGVPVVRATPAGALSVGTVLWLHGGAFTLMSAATHQHLAGHLAVESLFEVVIPDYSLAPEHPFPRALEEVSAVYGRLLGRGAHRAVFVVGDSAGGSLAVGVQLKARDSALLQPRLTVLLCPWLDLTLRQASLVANAEHDAVLDARTLPFHVAAYLGGEDAVHPLASPVHAELGGLGPLYIQAAEYDVLVDDSRRFARLAVQSGLDVELEIAPESPHCYQFFAGVIPEADGAIIRIAAKLREYLGEP